jgi:hypothetical protein
MTLERGLEGVYVAQVYFVLCLLSGRRVSCLDSAQFLSWGFLPTKSAHANTLISRNPTTA